jgi:hypothetical protein
MINYEIITWKDQPLVYIIHTAILPEESQFVTPSDFKQQVGFIVYPTGAEIGRHIHRKINRHLVGTSEVLIVKKGRCMIEVFNDDKELVAQRELTEGDVMLMVGGGHGFKVLEDTVLLEVKQGPYLGIDEKEGF